MFSCPEPIRAGVPVKESFQFFFLIYFIFFVKKFIGTVLPSQQDRQRTAENSKTFIFQCTYGMLRKKSKKHQKYVQRSKQ